MTVALLVGIWTVIIATLIPAVRVGAWYVRVFDFPRAQIASLGLLLGGLSVWMLPLDDWFTALSLSTLGVALVWHAAIIVRFTPLAPKRALPATKGDVRDRIRLMNVNVRQDNRDASKLLALVEKEQPDLLMALECDEWWERQLLSLASVYKYVLRQVQDDTYGMLFFSKLELIDPEIRFLRLKYIPSIRTKVRLRSDRIIHFYGVHPSPPVPAFATSSRQRDAELIKIGREIAKHGQPSIVLGDLNDVAWSYTTRLFQRISRTLDPRLGRRPMATFPVNWPFLRFPLDHIFFSDHFTLASFDRLPDVGSDHFPILAELQYEEDAQARQAEPIPDAEDHENAREIMEEAGE